MKPRLFQQTEGLTRNITTRCPHFGQIPAKVASTLLVMTTKRYYCERYIGSPPLRILVSPTVFPRKMYAQLLHKHTQTFACAKFLRACVKSVAAALKQNEKAFVS